VRAALSAYAAVQVTLFAVHRPVTPQWTFVWLTPVLLAIYLVTRPRLVGPR